MKPIAAVVLSLATSGALAQTAQTINIPGQAAAQAVTRLSELTGLRIDAAPELLADLKSRPVNGTLSPRLALQRMLEGSDIEVLESAEGVTLRRANRTAVSQLDTMVVTARKTNERMFDVPIAMSALTGDSLRKQGLGSALDALQGVPGVSQVDTGSGYSSGIAIRGVSANQGSNVTGYYLDELPFTAITTPIAPDVRSWDLDRIEVLRGPQGTLFGEGSMGGTVRILTNAPRLGQFGFAAQGGLAQTAGGASSSSAKVMANLPIGDTFALRLNGTHEKLGGWLDDLATGEKDTNGQRIDTVRLRARWEPTDRLRVDASYMKYDNDFGKSNYGGDTGYLTQTGGLVGNTTYALSGLSVGYDFDAVSVFYSYSHNKISIPLTGALLGGTSTVATDIGVTSHELRLSSAANSPLRWTAGLYARNADRVDSVLIDSPVFQLNSLSDTGSKTTSVFGEVSYSLIKEFELTAGARKFRDKQTHVESNAGVSTGPARTANSSSFDTRLSLAWKPNRDTQVYASRSTGFRGGQFQTANSITLGQMFGLTFPDAIQPDSVVTYELGTKLSLLDRRLAFEAAVYTTKWKDIMVSVPISTTGLSGLINAGGSRTNGLELSAAFQATPDLALTLAAVYTDAHWTTTVTGTGITSGGRVDEIPRTQLNGAADYRFGVVAGWSTNGRLSLVRSSPRESHTGQASVPGDAILNAGARLAFDKGPWTVTLYGDNLSNDHGAVSARKIQPLSATLTDIYAVRLRPRTFGLELHYAMGR
nr:TonB-dependent receptor [uncultured Roseateles sp.]